MIFDILSTQVTRTAGSSLDKTYTPNQIKSLFVFAVRDTYCVNWNFDRGRVSMISISKDG